MTKYTNNDGRMNWSRKDEFNHRFHFQIITFSIIKRVKMLVKSGLLGCILTWHSLSCQFSSVSSFVRTTPSKTSSHQRLASSSFDSTGSTLISTLQNLSVIDPQSGKPTGACDDLPLKSVAGFRAPFLPASAKTLLVLCPAFGDFETWEYMEQLLPCLDDLRQQNIQLRVIGVGDSAAAQTFAQSTKIPLEYLRADPTAAIHQALQLHRGPNWDIPSWIPQALLNWFQDYTGASPNSDPTLVARAWLNYMAMCAGVSAPDTLPEILRGYFGDRTAPERLGNDDVVTVGDNDIVIRGTTDVKLGPIEYQSLWKDAQGYQRPAELATVRLRGMVEVLSNFNDYVPDQTVLDWRGATYLLDADGQVLYSHRDTGVLAYSKTMPRPLTFLEPYIGPKALNPLALGDQWYDENGGKSRVSAEESQALIV